MLYYKDKDRDRVIEPSITLLLRKYYELYSVERMRMMMMMSRAMRSAVKSFRRGS
jgi:hypothetical protein